VAGEKGESGETILHGIMNSDLPKSDKNAHRLFQEALTIVGAGSETTGSTLEYIFYYALTEPKIKARLLAELSTAKENGGDLSARSTLKNLPYLDACMKESLRLANGVSGRLPRYDPVNTIVWKEYALPPGTIISMTTNDMHMDPNCFPDPTAFNPDRWFDPVTAKQGDQYFAPFSKGSRACIGRDLAQLEILITAGVILSTFEMEICDTTYDDIKGYHDYFAPFCRYDSDGLKVILK
jgi:cytochrome P450